MVVAPDLQRCIVAIGNKDPEYIAGQVDELTTTIEDAENWLSGGVRMIRGEFEEEGVAVRHG